MLLSPSSCTFTSKIEIHIHNWVHKRVFIAQGPDGPSSQTSQQFKCPPRPVVQSKPTRKHYAGMKGALIPCAQSNDTQVVQSLSNRYPPIALETPRTSSLHRASMRQSCAWVMPWSSWIAWLTLSWSSKSWTALRACPLDSALFHTAKNIIVICVFHHLLALKECHRILLLDYSNE